MGMHVAFNAFIVTLFEAHNRLVFYYGIYRMKL